MGAFRKKPVIIEAYRTDTDMDIKTLEGVMHANAGDWIITGVNGEQYPCKPDIFEKTYEPADGPEEFSFSEWLENEIRKRGLTRKEASKLTGFSMTTLYHWIYCMNSPTVGSINDVLNAFGKKIIIVDKGKPRKRRKAMKPSKGNHHEKYEDLLEERKRAEQGKRGRKP